MSCHLECVFTHIFFGGLLFVMGIVDLLFNYGDFWTGPRFFVIFCGVWMYITGVILARNRKRGSCRRKAFAGAFITSSLCAVTVGACYSFILHVLIGFCGYSECQPRKAFAAIVFILSFVQCIAGCCGCYCVAFSSSQADQILCPPNVPGGNAQMAPICMPPRSVFHANDQQNDWPPPYTVDAQTCSHGSDLLLVPLEMTPMPPQETGPPPPYPQISTTESVMSSFHDGDQPPAYVCTDKQHRVTTYV